MAKEPESTAENAANLLNSEENNQKEKEELIRKKVNGKIKKIEGINVFKAWFNDSCATVIEKNILSSKTSSFSVWFVVYETKQREMPEIVSTIEIVGKDNKKICYSSLEEAQKKAEEIRKGLTDESSKYYNNPFLIFHPKESHHSVFRESISHRKWLVEEKKYEEIYPSNLDDYLKPLDIIKVGKVYAGVAPFQHVGVYLGNNWICHINDDNNGTSSIVNWEGFSKYRSSELIRFHPIIPFKHNKKIIEHIAKALVSKYGEGKYHFIEANCEHFANELIYGIKFSEQVGNAKKWNPLYFFGDKKNDLEKQMEESDKKWESLVSPDNNEKVEKMIEDIKRKIESWKKEGGEKNNLEKEKQQLAEIEELKKNNNSLTKEKSDLERQLGELKIQVATLERWKNETLEELNKTRIAKMVFKRMWRTSRVERDRRPIVNQYDQVLRERDEAQNERDNIQLSLDKWLQKFSNKTADEVSNTLSQVCLDLLLERDSHDVTKQERDIFQATNQSLRDQLQTEQQSHLQTKQKLNSIPADWQQQITTANSTKEKAEQEKDSREKQIVQEFITKLKLTNLNNKNSSVEEVIKTVQKLIENSPNSPISNSYEGLRTALKKADETISNLEKKLVNKPETFSLGDTKKIELQMLQKFFPKEAKQLSPLIKKIEGATTYQQVFNARNKLVMEHISQTNQENSILTRHREENRIIILLLSFLLVTLITIVALANKLRISNKKNRQIKLRENKTISIS